MKKALSLVLALAMVLSMAVVGFAATYTNKAYEVEIGDVYADGNNGYVDVDVDVLDKNVTAIEVTAVDDQNAKLMVNTVNALENTYKIWVSSDIDNFVKAYITVTVKNGKTVVEQNTYTVEYTPAPVAQEYLIKQMEKAYKNHSTTVELDASKLDDETLYVADWKYITNTYKDLWTEAEFLGMDLEVTLGTTIYSIPMADIIWYKNDVDFSIYTNVVDEDGYNLIRELTGDTKNPLVFGFDGMACPDLTVDMVIPQQWINYYGHKDLTLFAWQEPITAIIQNGADKDKEITIEDAKVLTKTSLDVNTTVTQRIQFKTDYLYEVLVLTANGVADTNNGGSNDDNKDANPNTGANDIVNIAVVFAVVSLAAAGAFVCKKSK